MSSNKTSTGSGGVGFCGALAITFIVLRLCGVIQWSWLWVLAPLWIPISVVSAVCIVVLCVWAVVTVIRSIR